MIPSTSKCEYKRTAITNPFELGKFNKADNLKINLNDGTNRTNAVQNSIREQPPQCDFWDEPQKPAVRSNSNQLQSAQIRTNFVPRVETARQIVVEENVQNVSSAWLSSSMVDRPQLNPNTQSQVCQPASTSIRKSVFDRLGPHPKDQKPNTRPDDRPVMQPTANPLDTVDFLLPNQPSKNVLKELSTIEQKVFL